MTRKLDNLLLPAPQTLRVGVQGESIAIIDIASSSKTEHTYTAGRGRESPGIIYTGVRSGVISIGVITIHQIHVGDGDGADSGNSNDAGDSIISSSSSSYLGRNANQTKEEILQRCVVCVKNKRVPEVSRERDIHHANATKVLSHTFGAAKHFVPKNSEEESESTKYTNIKSEYVGKLAKIELLEASIMAYDMRYLFIIPTMVDEYDGALEERWENCAATGVYLLSHWSKVYLCVVSQFQRYSYENFSDNEDIVSCEWKKELFIKSSYPALTKRAEYKYEALDGLGQGGIT